MFFESKISPRCFKLMKSCDKFICINSEITVGSDIFNQWRIQNFRLGASKNKSINM